MQWFSTDTTVHLHAYHGPVSTPILCHGTSKDSDSKHRNSREMAAELAGTSTSGTMRVQCIVFYVDPKSVGSLNFLRKERVRFPITDVH